MENRNIDFALVKYIEDKYIKNIIDMLTDISSRTGDYHCLTINFPFDSSITFDINKNKKKIDEAAFVGSVNFGDAIDLLKAGLAVRRKGWKDKGMFIVKYLRNNITGDIIPKMQQLSQSAKNILMNRENPHIHYTNQILIIKPDSRADSWVPSSSDVFAEDWEVVTE